MKNISKVLATNSVNLIGIFFSTFIFCVISGLVHQQQLNLFQILFGTVLSILLYGMLFWAIFFVGIFVLDLLIICNSKKKLKANANFRMVNYKYAIYLLDNNISRMDIFSLQELLFVTKDLSGKYSLFVYDKKTKKIVSSFFKKTPYLEIIYNYQNYYLDKTITCIYEDATGKGIKIKLKKENTKFKISTNESIEIKKKPQKTQAYNMLPEFESTLKKNTFSEKKLITKYNESEGKKILNISSVKVKKDFYYLPVKVETIENSNTELNANDNYAVWDKEKIGLYSLHANSLIIPNSYDAIVKDETLQNNYKCPPVFILINQNKYGLFIYDSPKNKIIEPVFDKIPLLVDYNYFGKSQPLMKLYDQNGNLFSYCNEEGKIYYSEK